MFKACGMLSCVSESAVLDVSNDPIAFKFNIDGTVHRSMIIAITNKMQLSNGILLFHSTLIVRTINVLWNNKIPLLSCILLVIAIIILP